MAKIKRKKPVTLSEFNGDHGTGTKAAKAGTIMERLDGPNKMARRRRINRLDDMSARGQISLRQYQAGQEIQLAWCQCETLSSGGELKEQVDASPKPDATIARQVDAQSRLQFAMTAVPSAMRYVIEHVCWYNRPMHELPSGSRNGSHAANLKVALDLVANKMRY